MIWEAQYGDFINGAQVVVDEFVASARSKWGQTPSLVLLLPHGAEGQGPDHSSGRLERFLELAAEINLRIANCTTAAQYFHLLRRQAALLRTDPLPLVVMTPKRLLRHPLVSSPLRDLAEGGWQPVLDDAAVRDRPDAVERLVVCSGKIAVDLAESAGRKDHPELAIVRLEQLYPFPDDAVRAVLTRYARVRDVCWVQEEPENMGAWTFVQPRFAAVLGGGRRGGLHSRAPNASPAEGSHARYAVAQAQLIQQALESRVAGGAARKRGEVAGRGHQHRCADRRRVRSRGPGAPLAEARGRGGGRRRGPRRARDGEGELRGDCGGGGPAHARRAAGRRRCSTGGRTRRR